MKRIFIDKKLLEGETLELSGALYHYLCRVVRVNIAQQITLFNGDGFDYLSEIVSIEKRRSYVKIIEKESNDNESQLYSILLQGISKGDKMDFVIQKAVELGVNEIYPVETEFSSVKLNSDRKEKKVNHWKSIITSACEQSRRAIIPKLHNIMHLAEAVKELDVDVGKKLFLHPYTENTLKTGSVTDKIESIAILTGPEGGLSDNDLKIVEEAGFKGIMFGKRILRTETAAISSLAVSQFLWGDINV